MRLLVAAAFLLILSGCGGPCGEKSCRCGDKACAKRGCSSCSTCHCGLSSSLMSVSDEASFKNKISSKKLVLVDFFADYCGPCKQMMPTIKELANEYKGRVDFLKVDIKSQSWASNYNVLAVPTIIFFKGGKEISNTRLVGFQSKDVLKKRIDKLLK